MIELAASMLWPELATLTNSESPWVHVFQIAEMWQETKKEKKGLQD